MSQIFDSPFVVPVAGCAMILGLGVAGIISEMRTKELRSQERIAMLNRGMSIAEIEQAIGTVEQEAKRVRDPLRSLANTRRAAIVLISVGVGLGLFGLILWAVLQVRPVLIVAGAGVINVAIGVGFLVDYSMQKRELARFGMDLLDEPNSFEGLPR